MQALAVVLFAVLGAHSAGVQASTASPVQVATFEQGVGVVLSVRPTGLDARRNIRPGSISGLDRWSVDRWLSWRTKRAYATATYWWNTPDGRNVRGFRSRLILDRVKNCGPHRIYTRITGRFLGSRSPGMPTVLRYRTYKVNC